MIDTARYYLDEAGQEVALDWLIQIKNHLDRISLLGLMFREGVKPGTRECPLSKYPYTIVYRITGRTVRVVRVLHQRRAYFQR